jgi:hypothetical protein
MSGLAVSPLNLEGRRRTDFGFALLYIALLIAVVAICAYTRSTATDSLEKLQQCIDQDPSGGGGGSAIIPGTWWAFSYLPSSPVAALLFGLGWMALLKRFARGMVYATLIAKGLLMMGLGVAGWKAIDDTCTLTTGDCVQAYYPLILTAFGALYLLVLACCLRERVRLTAELIEQAVVVVSQHPGVFLASGFLFLLKALFLGLCIAAYLLLFASQVDVTVGQPCTYEWRNTNTDTALYIVLTTFFYWSVQLWLCMRYYVVSLVTGVWYYQNTSLAAQEGTIDQKASTRAPVCTSLRLAFTKSFGSIAFASLIMAICEWLRRLARKERRNGGLIGCLIACCIQCILAYVEFLTRFALTFHALSGEPFCDSGRTFLGHCQRHGFLKVYTVDWLASVVLNFGAVILGLSATAITVLLLNGSSQLASYSQDDKIAVLGIVGGVAWAIACVILLFIAGILHDVVDASYACLVLDLDSHARTGQYHQPQMAQTVLIQVRPGYVVEQPGGMGVAYANPQPIQPVPTGTAVAYVVP